MASANIPQSPGLVSTGLDGLDFVLGGGLPAQRMFLLSGDPGTGKSTLALQYSMQGVREGDKVLYLTLSQTKDDLEMIAASHGWSLDGIEIVEFTGPGEILSADVDHTVFFPSDVDLGEVLQNIQSEVERVQPDRLVIDSATEIRLMSGEELRFRRQFLALKQFLVQQSCTVLIIDPDATNDESAQLHSIAHGTIVLEQHAPNYGDVYRRLTLLKMRGVNIRGGYHDFSIETGGVRVYPRLSISGVDHYEERGQIQSGIDALDEMFGGGLERGTACLFLGLAGTGKSTMAALYALAAARRGHKAAIYSFDESRDTILIRTAGMDMDLQPQIDEGMLRVESLSASEVSSGQFSDQLRRAVEHDGVEVVVLDSLTGYIEAYPKRRRVATQLHDLVSFLGHRGALTIMTVPQHGFIDSEITSQLEVSYISDTVVVLRHFEEEGEIHQALAVVKRRRGGHRWGIRRFMLTSDGVKFGSPKDLPPGVLNGIPGIGAT